VRIMRTLALIALLLLAPGASGAAASSGTALTISVWPDERRAEVHRYSLRCEPAGGTLPRAAAACTRLAAGGVALFAPPPKEQVCIEIYGGPQRAIVTGTVAGRRIWVSLRRQDGCEIERWRKLAFLLPRSAARLP
jgi:Subtilisin inhibitor-like